MILMYHKIYPESPTVWWVTPNDFWRQMEDLRRYRVVPLDEYEPSNPDHVVITFDGIYDNVLTYALPILRRFGYPFELFIVGDAIGRDNEFDRDAEPAARFADTPQLKATVRHGARIQWHGVSHDDLSRLENPETIDGQLRVPDGIRKLDPNGFTWFAYPNGKHSDLAVERVRKVFHGAVSCVDGNDHDRYKLNRVMVTNESSFARSTVSLIVANYNYGRYAAEAIESALHQTVQPDEILFIDDCSTDNSMEVAERYRDSIRIVRNERNLGIVANFNKAVSLTRGDYICFLGADNRLRSDYIEKCKLALDKHKDAAIAYTNVVLFGPRAEPFAVKAEAKPAPGAEGIFLWEFPELDENAKKELDVHNIMHGSSMYRRSAFEEVGGYKKSDSHEDQNLFVRMVRKRWGAVRCPEFLLEYRQHSVEQASAQVNLAMELAYYRRQLKERESQIDALRGQLQEKQSEVDVLQSAIAKVVCKEQTIPEASRDIAQHIGSGKFEQAVQSARDTFREFPDQARLLHMYGLLLEHQGRHREAEWQLEQALLYDPAYAKAHNDLGTLYFRRGKTDKALYHLEQAVQGDPTNQLVRKNLADLYLATGREEDALRVCEETVVQAPNDIETLLSLGDLYSKLQRHGEADVVYLKVLELDPDNAEAQQNLQALNPQKMR